MLLVLFMDAAQGAAGQEVSCKYIIGGLVTAIVAMASYIVFLHAGNGKKVNEVYEGRIADLKANHDLVDTLIRKVAEEKKGGG